jgi:hypothetical protein
MTAILAAVWLLLDFRDCRAPLPPLSRCGASHARLWNFEPDLNCRRPMDGRLNCTFTPQLTA